MKAIAPYAGRSAGYAGYCNPRRKAWLNPQKSVWVIVPEKPVKADGGKDPAIAGNTVRTGPEHAESSCSKEDVCRRIGE